MTAGRNTRDLILETESAHIRDAHNDVSCSTKPAIPSFTNLYRTEEDGSKVRKYNHMNTNATVETAVAARTAYPDEYAPLTFMTVMIVALDTCYEGQRVYECDSHLFRSQPRCLRPLREWNAKGAARIALPAYLTASGRPPTNSMMCAESNVAGATR